MNTIVAAQAPQKQDRSPIEVLRSQLDAMDEQILFALPKHIPLERFKRVVVTSIQNNIKLMEVDRRQLFGACMKAAQDGLLPDGREGALVIRGSVAKGNGSVTWQPMIAGIRKKARNSGEISSWDAHCVYGSDPITIKFGDDPSIDHTLDPRKPRGELLGAYSICVLKDGTKSFEWMDLTEIYGIRDRSDAWKAYKAGYIKTTPWLTDEAEMARKTVARRHSKMLPTSSDLDDLIRRDDDLYEFSDTKEDVQQQRKSRPAKLTMDNFASPSATLEAPTDEPVNTIENTEQPQPEKVTASGGDEVGKLPASPASSQVTPPRDVSLADEARAGSDGELHASEGRSLRAMPAEYRDEPILNTAYTQGFNSVARSVEG